MTSPRPRRADFHTHSTASDGTLAPADLVYQASRRGLTILALTDHDTTLGLAPAMAAAADLGIRLIPGIELSTDVEHGEIHILGYSIDPADATLQTTLATLRQARESRIDRMVAQLRSIGITLNRDAIQPNTPGGSIGRPHVARAMVDAGYVESVPEAFARFIGNGRPGYVPSQRLTPAEAVRLIVAAGGLAFHAHPLTSPLFPGNLDDLIAAGLAGLEAYYGEYTPSQCKRLAAIGRAHGLLLSGGSDYHGDQLKHGRDLGEVDIPDRVTQVLLAALAARTRHGLS